MKRLISVIAAFAAMILVFSGCVASKPAATTAPASLAPTAAADANTVDSIKKRGELIVATNAEFPPFEFMDGMNFVGIDMEIAQKIADKLGVKLKIDNVSFDAVLAAVPSGKADLGIAGLSVKPDRLETMDFSDQYFSSNVVMLVAKDNDTLKTKDDLVGKKLGVQLGTSADTLVASGVKDAEVVRMNKDADSVQDLINGKLDAALMDINPAQVFAQQNPDKIKLIDTPLSDEPYAIAAKKGNTELLAVVNEVIKELKDSGEFAKICDKYGVALVQ